MLHRPTPDTEVAETVYLSQRDVRELQFAKAAISTGWTLLLEQLGLEAGDVQQVLLAGSFGSYLSPASAIRIGLVPKLPVLRIVSAGNVAGEGAKMALLSLRERAGRGHAAGGGGVCRALRPRRVQRPVRRPPRVPGLTVALIACGAIAQPAARIVERARLAGRRAPAAAAAAQPAPADRGRGAPGWPSSCRRRTTPWWWGTPTAAPTAPSTRSASGSGCAGCAGLHCYDVYAGASRIEALLRRPARHLPAHRLPGEVVRAHRRDRARPGPVARAARGVLPPLHARRLAGPGRDPRAAGRRRGRRRPTRPAPDRRTDGERGAGAGAGGAVVRWRRRFPRTSGETGSWQAILQPASVQDCLPTLSVSYDGSAQPG